MNNDTNYNEMIGQRVRKCPPNSTKEPKPFKSGGKINTVKGIIEHPQLGVPAFTFVEDDSYVECRRCYPLYQEIVD